MGSRRVRRMPRRSEPMLVSLAGLAGCAPELKAAPGVVAASACVRSRTWAGGVVRLVRVGSLLEGRAGSTGTTFARGGGSARSMRRPVGAAPLAVLVCSAAGSCTAGCCAGATPASTGVAADGCAFSALTVVTGGFAGRGFEAIKLTLIAHSATVLATPAITQRRPGKPRTGGSVTREAA